MELLKKIWHGWLRFGLFIGNLFGRIILTILYFTIVLPFGILTSLAMDPLNIKHPAPVWVERTTRDRTIDDARRSF
jgi:hypothetical protein